MLQNKEVHEVQRSKNVGEILIRFLKYCFENNMLPFFREWIFFLELNTKKTQIYI